MILRLQRQTMIRYGATRRMLAVAALLAGSLVSLTGTPSGAAAASTPPRFRLTTSLEGHDADPGDGACATATGLCTLRAAVEEADATAGGAFVDLADASPHRYTLTLGSLVVSTDVRLVGTGPFLTTLVGPSTTPLLDVQPDSTLTVSSLTLTSNTGNDGSAVTVGAGATLRVDSTRIVDNAVSGAGAGIDAQPGSTVTLRTAFIARNTASGGGGGIAC